MNAPRSGLALALVLVLGCNTGKVSAPPAPPRSLRPEAAQPAATSAALDSPAPAPAQLPELAPGSAPLAGTTAGAGATEAQATAPSATPPDAKPATEVPKPNPPLGWVAGKPLEAEEVLLEWGDVASRELLLVVDKLVAGRLALAEAGRLGIKLSPEAVEQRYVAEKARLEKKLARGKEGASLEEFIRKELGFDPGRYLDRVRRATIRQMLAERAVRASSLANESVALRLIVVPGDAEVAKVKEALAKGRDFGDVARELSVDDSKETGGLVPFVVAQERSPLARLAFQTAVGEVAGPLPIADHQFLIRVENRRAPLEGDWPAIESAVEASLAEHPVADAEFVHWKLSMEERYPIDLGPLWSLLGAAR